jgi:hypothetical protein
VRNEVYVISSDTDPLIKGVSFQTFALISFPARKVRGIPLLREDVLEARLHILQGRVYVF